MSEIGLSINVDSYNNEGIKTIKGNNNAEIYKLYILKNKRRLSLVGKTVKLGYVMAGTTKGDIIENLNITNAEQGEITFPITNRISKKDGVYSCQLAIYGADEFLEYTATFGLTVEANIFTKIAGEIENSKDLTYIERILEEATNISEELKSNIPVARQLNSDLENQNRILNENMDRANGVNNTLITTTEQSKVAATDAIEKKSQLEKSITKAKEFIDGLDGSQNIPGIRMELTELQNGLKSNQALAYQGSSIATENTLEGRTEVMKITGLTLQNLFAQEGYYVNPNGSQQYFHSRKYKNLFKAGKYTLKNITGNALIWDISRKDNDEWVKSIKSNKSIVIELEEGQYVRNIQALTINGWILNESTKKILEHNVVILEGDRLDIIDSIDYFEGIKSFGEAEQEGDKYKISILSTGKNLAKLDLSNKNITLFKDGYRLDCVALYRGDEDIFDLKGKYKENTQYVLSYYGKILDNSNANNYRIRVYYTDNTYTDGVVTGNKYEKRIIKTLSGKTVYKIIGYYGSMNGDFIVKDVMLEEGTQATQYELYKCDKKDILIKEPLRGFDENTCDIMHEDNGQVKINRQIGEYKITGDELINRQSESAYTRFTIDNIPGANRTVGRHFIINSKVNFLAEGNKPMVGFLYNGSFFFYINNQNTDTVEMAREFIKGTTLYYQLATPTVEIVDNCVDIDLDTYQEKTYFNILNSLPGTLDFKVPSNIGSLVQSNAKEINNINEFINNFILKALLEMNKDLAAIKIKNGLN
ncbi:BppU family phage baseplate upper protein (plasmid) [Clostridium perfringens]|uniref:BppU family phage baseplate upper protein n=5 Tax=Clostridium perfringens TaxID=1502 RepID=UPI00096A7405|nr:BppU family phage baseplate upper protein [Clostridium perfringens]